MRVATRAKFMPGRSGWAAGIGILAACGAGQAMADAPTALSWSYTSKCYLGGGGDEACCGFR